MAPDLPTHSSVKMKQFWSVLVHFFVVWLPRALDEFQTRRGHLPECRIMHTPVTRFEASRCVQCRSAMHAARSRSALPLPLPPAATKVARAARSLPRSLPRSPILYSCRLRRLDRPRFIIPAARPHHGSLEKCAQFGDRIGHFKYKARQNGNSASCGTLPH